MPIKFKWGGVKLLKHRHDGFILIESISSLAISIMIIFTLTICINEQFKVLTHWEQRVNAHKIILLHLNSKDIPNKIIIKNQAYYFQQKENKYQVTVNKNVYQAEVS